MHIFAVISLEYAEQSKTIKEQYKKIGKQERFFKEKLATTACVANK